MPSDFYNWSEADVSTKIDLASVGLSDTIAWQAVQMLPAGNTSLTNRTFEIEGQKPRSLLIVDLLEAKQR